MYIFIDRLFEQKRNPAVILPIADNTCLARVSLTLKMYTTLGHGIAREGGRGEMASHLVHNLCNNQVKIIRQINNIIMHVRQQSCNILYTSQQNFPRIKIALWMESKTIKSWKIFHKWLQ